MKQFRSMLLFLYYCIPISAIYLLFQKEYGAAILAILVFAAIYSIRHRKKRNGPANTPGIEYESRCAKYLEKKGYRKVEVTPASGDYGADVIGYDRKGRKWVFQCKSYSGSVGNSAVQEVVAAKAHYKADCAAVMTNSVLTANAKKLALENDVELFEMLDL